MASYRMDRKSSDCGLAQPCESLDVLLLPAGLVYFGLGFKVLMIDSPRRAVVFVRR